MGEIGKGLGKDPEKPKRLGSSKHYDSAGCVASSVMSAIRSRFHIELLLNSKLCLSAFDAPVDNPNHSGLFRPGRRACYNLSCLERPPQFSCMRLATPIL